MSREAEISLQNKRAAFTCFAPSLACSAMKQTRTQLEIFRNRGQQLAGHARALTSHQILWTEPANRYLEIHAKHRESNCLYGYTSGKLNFISFFHICQPFNKAKRQTDLQNKDNKLPQSGQAEIRVPTITPH